MRFQSLGTKYINTYMYSALHIQMYNFVSETFWLVIVNVFFIPVVFNWAVTLQQ